jgi:hypothetical protein
MPATRSDPHFGLFENRYLPTIRDANPPKLFQTVISICIRLKPKVYPTKDEAFSPSPSKGFFFLMYH